MLQQAEAIRDQLIAWRRDIHAHPELSGEEYESAKQTTPDMVEEQNKEHIR